MTITRWPWYLPATMIATRPGVMLGRRVGTFGVDLLRRVSGTSANRRAALGLTTVRFPEALVSFTTEVDRGGMTAAALAAGHLPPFLAFSAHSPREWYLWDLDCEETPLASNFGMLHKLKVKGLRIQKLEITFSSPIRSRAFVIENAEAAIANCCRIPTTSERSWFVPRFYNFLC
jgi:hypothetical protein